MFCVTRAAIASSAPTSIASWTALRAALRLIPSSSGSNTQADNGSFQTPASWVPNVGTNSTSSSDFRSLGSSVTGFATTSGGSLLHPKSNETAATRGRIWNRVGMSQGAESWPVSATLPALMVTLDWIRCLVVASAVGGCSFGDPDVDDRPERPGELGNGTFRYICVGDSDPFCENGFVADTFPERFALGGAFDLDFDPHDYFPLPDEPLPRVIAPAPDSVRGEAMAFIFTRAGYAAFLARNTRGEVIDLRHLYGAPVARIAVVTANSQELSTLEMQVGEDIDVEVEPQDTLRSVLAGSLHYEYTTDDPTVAEIFSVDEDRDVTIRAVGPGETTLKVTAGAYTQELTVVVEGDENPTTGDSDSDSDTDAGEESSTGGEEESTGGSGGESTGGSTSGDPTTGGGTE